MGTHEQKETEEREIVDPTGSDAAAESGSDDRVESQTGSGRREIIPTTADAIGRELIAIRSVLVGALALTDAALTNFRMLQLQNDTVDALTGDVGDGMSLHPAGKIARLARLAAQAKNGESAVPRTFGDGRRRTRDTNSGDGNNGN